MNVAIVGASGYVGAELVGLINQHSKLTLIDLVVSQNSDSAGKLFSELHKKYRQVCDKPLQAFSKEWINTLSGKVDAVFLATPHEFSVQWAHEFLNIGIKVFDLSGGFRLKNSNDYPKYYGFAHEDLRHLASAQYGLAEWYQNEIKQANLIAVPGCYPTASLLALKPVTENALHATNSLISVNGISGVSGAGRKASLATSFNEVSLAPYNVLKHRHQPEISQEAGSAVTFTPHLAPYKRGLLATVTVQLNSDVTTEQVSAAYLSAYEGKKAVRVLNEPPKIDDVANTPFADVYFQYDEATHVLVACCAIDNLLKGAASQAIQCVNLTMGLDSTFDLIQGQNYEQ